MRPLLTLSFILSALFALVRCDRHQAWIEKAQQGEFDFWMSHFDDMVEARTKREWFLKYKKYFFDNGGFNVEKDFFRLKVVDIGSGPRPLSFVFVGANISVIEPLGERFLEAAKIKIPQDSKDYLEIQRVEKVYSRPAEEFVEELEGTAHVVISTNSLDHTFARKLKPMSLFIDEVKNLCIFHSCEILEKCSRLPKI